ncbi:MAG: GAF domain-containing sensor histidine kinase [Bacillota bacterium]|nr:GAF domain-containing sensor histidine kinase [Bacillota bacterium]
MGTEAKARRLATLLEMSSLLASQLDLGVLLQTVVDSARDLCSADISGLLVLDEDEPDRYGGFWVSGWETPPAHYPTGAGLFNLPLKTGCPLRVDDVPSHPLAVGTPPGHPPVGPFLGVPLRFQEQILGTLFVANLTGGHPFSREDEELMVAFAAHAAVAIHNARLYQQAEELAVLRERQRLAMELHDTVAQIFFRIGLEAERLRELLPEDQRERLASIAALASRGSAAVRAAIAELHERGGLPEEAGLYELLTSLTEEFKAQFGFEVGLIVTGPVHRVTAPVRELIHRAAREALTNVAKHARARMAVVNLAVDGSSVRLTVQDDGVGPDAGALRQAGRGQRFGLAGIRRLAGRLGGGAELRAGVDGGCVLRVWAPLEPGRCPPGEVRVATDTGAGGG